MDMSSAVAIVFGRPIPRWTVALAFFAIGLGLMVWRSKMSSDWDIAISLGGAIMVLVGGDMFRGGKRPTHRRQRRAF